jgi:hypothetical protein
MRRISSAVPALTEISAALRKTTEVLAKELVVPTDEPPPWTDFEWRIARAVAAMQGISVLLEARLRWQGPARWRQFLDEQRHHSLLRYVEITRVLELIASLACRDGIALVALKGAALYQQGVYAAGERPMGDIDLLVCNNDAKALAQLLETCGYEAAFATRRHEVFQPRLRKIPSSKSGEHIDNPIKIEVHTKIAEHLPISTVDITQFLLTNAQGPGVNAYPSSASLLLHLLLHAAGNMRARALRLIQLHDIALLAARMDHGDWEQLFASRPNGEPLWWVWAPLCLTARYYPAAIKLALFERQSTESPWLLRNRAHRQRLSDVSWSNIRIAAFPGLEWSRTPREALAFMKSRAWPSRAARLELNTNAAQIPGFSSVPWYGISHAARILRWIFTRPPRVQTMLAVRAVLMQD